jgi:hypothetical protein
LRYLHWDKVRHLKTPEKFDSIEQYWYFLKFSRIGQQKLLPFTEEFFYILTDDITPDWSFSVTNLTNSSIAGNLGGDTIFIISNYSK